MHRRFEDFAARFGPGSAGAPPALGEDYWRSLRELFTRDVTRQGLTDLLRHETADTFRFFTRAVELADLQSQPWHRRYPRAAWRVFLAMAYRLSPARRILFAAAVPLLCASWLRYLLRGATGSWIQEPAFLWTLAAGTLVFALLALELRDKLALKGDLEVARQIQFGLLPFEPYSRGGLSVHAAMRPANTVGGDYFDLIELPDARLAVVIGDVAGKGMPAALLMALLQGSLRTLITAGLGGAPLVAKLNAHLCANIPSNRLVTLFYGEVDPAAGTLRYVNAGHNAPYLLRCAAPQERLASTAPALGVLPDVEFCEMVTPLEPGDRLFLFTDGISETFDASEQEYGEDRLAAFLQAHAALAPRELIDELLRDVLRFCGPIRPRDDMTALVLARGPVEPGAGSHGAGVRGLADSR